MDRGKKEEGGVSYHFYLLISTMKIDTNNPSYESDGKR